MSKDEYKELNFYLSMICKRLEVTSPIFLENMYAISSLGFYYLENYDALEKLFLGKEKKSKYVDFIEVSKIAGDIIELISTKYKLIYDDLLRNGVIDCDFELTKDSRFIALNNKIGLIDIQRKFTYDDISTLVHEFIHYTNSLGRKTYNQRFLTEFISIYFEIFAQNYLIEKYDVSIVEVGFKKRIEDTKKACQLFSDFIVPLYNYYKLGPIDEKTYEISYEYFFEETKEDYEKDCAKLLKSIENIKNKYCFNEWPEEILADNLVNRLCITNSADYIFGTYLAFFAQDRSILSEMVKLNDNINKEESANLSMFEYLYKYGINLNDDLIENSFKNMEKVLRK